MKNAIIAIYLLLITTNVYAQYQYTQISTSAFPKISVGFINNYPSKNFTSADFEVYEQNVLIPEKDVTIDCDMKSSVVKVLLLFDQSTSMGELINGKQKIEIVKQAAISFINKIELNEFSGVSIMGFGTSPNLYSDFINDKSILRSKISSIPVIPSSTDFNNAFLHQTKGAIELLSNQNNCNRCIIFLTDGNHDTELQGYFRSSEISSLLNANGIKLYSITFLNDYNSALQSISQEYYKVNETGELPEVFGALADKLTNYPFCKIIWNTRIPCLGEPDKVNVKVKFLPDNFQYTSSYQIPQNSFFYYKVDKSAYYFGNPEVDSSTTLDIKFKPKSNNALINNISISNNNNYKVIDFGNGNTEFPQNGIFVKAEEEYSIKLKFTQKVDNSAKSSDLLIDASPCSLKLQLHGGLGNLDISEPNKGDIYSICDGVMIKWVGVPEESKKEIYFKNGANNWNLIAKDVIGSEYLWKNIPNEGEFYIKVLAKLDLGYDEILMDSTESFFVQSPSLTANPSILDKDTTIVGAIQAFHYEKIIENNTIFKIKIISQEITGSAASDYNVNDYSGVELNPGDKISLDLIFTPTDFSNRPAVLHLKTDCGKPLEINLQLYGLCSGISKEEINFPSTFIGSQKDTLVEEIIYNAMSKEMTFDVFLSGINKNDFKIIGLYPGEKITLQPYTYYKLKVGFAPKTKGAKSAYLNFSISGCKNLKTKLKAFAIREGLEINNLQFGSFLLKSDYPTLNLKIFNKDPDSLQLINLDFVNKNDTNYFILADSVFPRILKGNDSLLIAVKFKTDIICEILSELKLVSNIEDTLYAKLSGKVYLPELKISTYCPEYVSYDSTGIAILELVNNSNSSNTNINNISITNTDEFSLFEEVFNKFIVLQGDTVVFPIKYKPKRNSSHSAEIIIDADNRDADFPMPWRSNFAEIICNRPVFSTENEEPKNIIICDSITNKVKIINTSKTEKLEVYLSKSNFSGKDKDAYILTDIKDITIDCGKSIELPVLFNARHKGEHSAVLNIPVNADNPIQLQLVNYGDLFSLESSINEIIIKPGEKFSPIINLITPEIYKDKLNGFDVDMLYNSDVLYFEGADINIDGKLYNDYSKLKIKIGEDKINFLFNEKFSKEAKVKIIPKFVCMLSNQKPSELDFIINYSCYNDTNMIIKIIRDDICMNDLRNVIVGRLSFFAKAPVPNPTKSEFKLDYTLGFKTNVSIKLYNIEGKQVKTLMNENRNSGAYTETFNIEELSAGTYYLEFRSAGYSETYLLIKSN